MKTEKEKDAFMSASNFLEIQVHLYARNTTSGNAPLMITLIRYKHAPLVMWVVFVC